ncbi:hypothetical protein L195_g048172, partial [Trifolium pratense]
EEVGLGSRAPKESSHSNNSGSSSSKWEMEVKSSKGPSSPLFINPSSPAPCFAKQHASGRYHR